MSTVDSRIVTMKFDNTTFERGVSSSITSLGKLKSAMNLADSASKITQQMGTITSALGKVSGVKAFSAAGSGLESLSTKLSWFSRLNPFGKATTGVDELQRETGRFQMTSMEGAVTGISKSFVAMSTVAITALANITTQALQTGTQLVKSLTLDPIIGGFQEYETNLNSIQTILANTGLKGKKGLDEVNSALTQLNHYSDKTIYNFSEMAKNIGTFTAAGVDLDTSVTSIKGIANLAAISGSNSTQASTAMYQLSQALASGKVSLMDWNSVVNAGMGGQVFQKALLQTAQTVGTLGKNAVKTVGPMKTLEVNGKSFRDSMASDSDFGPWLTSDVLTKTLSQLSGDMTDAELKAQGFTDSQVKAIQEMAKTGVNAATKVKTLTQLMDTMKEAVGSGWGKTFSILFGDFNEAKKLFTDVSQTMGGFISSSADARNKLLQGWKDLGGRDTLIQGISDAFHGLLDVLKPIGDAFREIFPRQTAANLMSMTQGFADWAKTIQITDKTAENLKRTFAGVFAIFDIVGHVIGGVIGMIARLAGSLSDGSGNFLDFTGGIGDFLVSLDKALTEGGALTRFFNGLGDILAVPLSLLRTVAGWIGKLFTGFDTQSAKVVTGAVDHVHDSLKPVSQIGKTIGNIFGKLGGWLATAAKAVGHALSDIGSAIADSMGPGTFDKALDVVNTALIGGIVLMIKNFMSGGVKIDLSGGLFDSIKQTLGAVTGQLQAMQTQLKSDVLLKIAISIGVLAGAIVLLASIDPKQMAFALGGLAVGFGAMQVALVKMTTAISYFGTLKLPAITAALVAMAGALLIFALAMKIMSSIEFGDLLRGLFGLGASLFIFVKAIKPLQANSKGLAEAAGAMVALGIAIGLIALALKIFASMDLVELGKGFIGLGGSLVIISQAMKLMPKGMVAQAIAIGILAGALNILGLALKIFGSMSAMEIAKSLIVLAGALEIIGFSMEMMPRDLLLTAAGLVAVGFALNLIGGALKIMASMSLWEMIKGLGALAGVMAILAVGLNLMNGTLMGSAALLVAAGALAVMVPPLMALGSMDLWSIIKALIGLAGVFTVFGLAAAVLVEVVPVMIGLGAAMLLLGAGLFLAGAGALLFATAFAEVVAVGGHGVRIMGQMIGTFIKSIPSAMKAFGKGILALVQELAKAGPKFVKAWSQILSNFLDGIIKNAPKMANAFLKMLEAVLKVVVNASPKISRAGLQLIVNFMQAISEKLPRIIDLGAKIIVQFMNGIARNDQKLMNAGARLVIDFINDTADAIDNHSEALGRAGARLAVAIVEGIANGIAGGWKVVGQAASDLASSALNSAKNFLGIDSPSKEFKKVGLWSTHGLAEGLKDHRGKKHVRDSIVRVSRDALREARKILRRTHHKELAEELFPKGRHHRRRNRHDRDPVEDHIDHIHKHRHRHRRNLEREYVRVSKPALERARKILREEHHKHLAELLKPKKPPRIRPVLDTSQVKKDAKKMHDMIHGGRGINPYVSSGRARTISADKQAARLAGPQADPTATVGAVEPPVQYVQNNYSPKALNPVEVYRKTNSQLTMAKEMIKKNAPRPH